jgi:hypothetical protein
MTDEDQLRLQRSRVCDGGGEAVIVHGQVVRPDEVLGYVAEDRTGVVTHRLERNTGEIISLDSLQQGGGSGTALVPGVPRESRRSGCTPLPNPSQRNLTL